MPVQFNERMYGGEKYGFSDGRGITDFSYLLFCAREPFQLPWGARRARNDASLADDSAGAFALCKLFEDFTRIASRKVEQVLAEPLVCIGVI